MAASQHPELIFVGGPQSGERAIILTRLAVMGRLASCDIALREEFISRQHVRFELSADGWLMEILSTNGARVNGKNYKAGKRLLLDTGDVVSVGVETEILFVAPGGDSEEALAAWRKQREPKESPAPAADDAPAPTLEEASAKTGARPAVTGEPPSAPGAPPPLPPRGGVRPIASAEKAQELSPAQKAQAEIAAKTKKYRKYAIYGGVYAIAIIVAIFFLSHLRATNVEEAKGPPQLSEKEIAAALTADNLPRSKDQVAADDALKEANTLYERRLTEKDAGRLYQVVKCYRTYLAKTAYPGTFYGTDGTQDQARYDQASKELMAYVTEIYFNAYRLERDKQWGKAQRQFQNLMNIVPEKQHGDPAHDVFFANVLKHAAFAGSFLPKK